MLSSLKRLPCIFPILITGFLFLTIPACDEERRAGIDFEFENQDVYYYPDNHVSWSFHIHPTGRNIPHRILWLEPDTLKEEGPYMVKISNNFELEFTIIDAMNFARRFSYILNYDSIDRFRNDYRDQYIGEYKCDALYSYEGEIRYYQDTLRIVKVEQFENMRIATRHDLQKEFEGVLLYFNGWDKFYCYHGGCSFKNDSIFYTQYGSLGNYDQTVYKGIKIIE